MGCANVDSNAVSITLRLYSLWDNAKDSRGRTTLWTGFAVTYTGVIVSFCFTAIEVYGAASL